MKKISIIKVYEINNYYTDSINYLSFVIPEWTEVSDEDFKRLVDMQHRTNNSFVILEFPDQKEFIAKTVEDYIKISKELEAKAAKDKKLEAERKAILKAKNIEKKRKQLEKLKAELGE